MKKIILTMIIGMLTAGAFAQTTTPSTASADKHRDIKDMRKDIKDERHDKRLRAYDLKHHDKAEAKAETKDIKADKKDIQGDTKDLKKDGVKHPQNPADKQIRKHNMDRKG